MNLKSVKNMTLKEKEASKNVNSHYIKASSCL